MSNFPGKKDFKSIMGSKELAQEWNKMNRQLVEMIPTFGGGGTVGAGSTGTYPPGLSIKARITGTAVWFTASGGTYTPYDYEIVSETLSFGTGGTSPDELTGWAVPTDTITGTLQQIPAYERNNQIVPNGTIVTLYPGETGGYYLFDYFPSASAPSGVDEKVKVTSSDTTTSYLYNKVSAGANITLTVINPGANEQLQISSSAVSADVYVKISAADTTTNYLENKLVAGTNITINKLNTGANEQLEIVATDTNDKVRVSATDTTPNYLQSKLAAGNGLTTSVTNPSGNAQMIISANLTVKDISGIPNYSGIYTFQTFTGEKLYWQNPSSGVAYLRYAGTTVQGNGGAPLYVGIYDWMIETTYLTLTNPAPGYAKVEWKGFEVGYTGFALTGGIRQEYFSPTDFTLNFPGGNIVEISTVGFTVSDITTPTNYLDIKILQFPTTCDQFTLTNTGLNTVEIALKPYTIELHGNITFSILDNVEINLTSNNVRRWLRGDTSLSEANLHSFVPQTICNELVLITNVSAAGHNLVIINDSADGGVSANHKVLTHTEADVILAPKESIWMVYDTVSSRWRTICCPGTGGTGGGHVIQDEGTPLTQRTNLNFVGDGVTVTDDAGNDATVVTVNSPLVAIIRRTSSIPDANGYYPAKIQTWNTGTLSWVDGADCKLLDAN